MIKCKNILALCTLIAISISACSQRPALPGYKRINTPTTEQKANPQNAKSPKRLPLIPNNSTTGKSIPQNSTELKLAPQDIFAKYSPAVFMIYTFNNSQRFQGSGFFINAKGLAVSNYHVFESTDVGEEIITLQDGRQYKLEEVIYKSIENDIFIFTVKSTNERFQYIPIATRDVTIGDKVYAISSPRGLENTFSSGEISQLRKGGIIQISVPIDHGSSGGALINEYGEAIGITSAGLDYSGANLNFAVTINHVKPHI